MLRENFLGVALFLSLSLVWQDRFLLRAAKAVLPNADDTVLAKVASRVSYASQFVYFYKAQHALSKCKVYHLYMDGSSIGGTPSELIYIWSPELEKGAYAPVCVTRLFPINCKPPNRKTHLFSITIQVFVQQRVFHNGSGSAKIKFSMWFKVCPCHVVWESQR